MAKPQIITFPFVLLLWDYWPLRRMAVGKTSADAIPHSRRRACRTLIEEKLPLFGHRRCQRGDDDEGAERQRRSVVAEPRPRCPSGLSNAIVSYVKYLEKALWPLHLAPMYPHPGRFAAGVAGLLARC